MIRIASFRRTLLVVWICASELAAQQKPPRAGIPSKSRAAASESSPEDLLWRSYVSGRNLPSEERCFLIFRLAEASEQIRTARSQARAETWSKELFRRASELPPSWNRTAFQKNSLETLSTVDPPAAFQLLPKVDAPSGDAADTPEDLRSSAAQKIFSRLWDTKGISALEPVRSEARQIGLTGEYPYLAMGRISERLVDQKNTDNVLLIFREALDFYTKGPHVRSGDRDFVNYLEGEWQYLPPPLQEEALRDVVAHLTRQEDSDPKVTQTSRLVTDKGVVSFHNDKVALLYRILPKVRQLDPEWANRLEDEFPDLMQTASGGKLQYSSDIRVANTTGASQGEVATVVGTGLQVGVLNHLRQEAATDPYQAANLLPSLSDPELQSEALASLAAAFASKDPGHAAELLAEAQKTTDKLTSEVAKLRALVSLAEGAVALHDYPQAELAMQKAFDLGEEVLSEDLDLHPGQAIYTSESLEELSVVTRLGTQVAFRSTMMRLDHLKNETLRAYLLIAAAEGLEKRAVVEAAGLVR